MGSATSALEVGEVGRLKKKKKDLDAAIAHTGGFKLQLFAEHALVLERSLGMPSASVTSGQSRFTVVTVLLLRARMLWSARAAELDKRKELYLGCS